MTQRSGQHGLVLVDTDVAFRDDLSTALERFGVSIVWRARVLGLLETIAASDPIAVVLSADLPGGDPIGLLRSIRSQRQWRDLPVYVVGAELSREETLKAYVEQADAVLTREVAVAEIAARALGRAKTAERARSDLARDAADAALELGGPGEEIPARGETDAAPFALEPSESDATHEVRTPGPLTPFDRRTAVPAEAPAVQDMPIGVSTPSTTSDLIEADDELDAPAARPATNATVPDVIIVEDDPSLLEMLRYALTHRGYQTLSFSNGLDALRAMRDMDTAGRQPVVLLDVDLPGIDGFRILHELSGCRPGDYQIILCTIHNSEATQVLGFQSGALDYLVKPLRMPIVLAKVERLVGRGSFNAAQEA